MAPATATTTTLVTGAGGFAGSHVLEMLTGESGRRPGTVAAWHRPGADPQKLPPVSGIRWQGVDLLDRESVRAAIAQLRPSAVYHCAGAAHVGKAWDDTEATFAINVRGTDHLLDALERCGVETRVLIPGSALVYHSADRALREDDPLLPSSPYAVSKLAQEMLAADAGNGVTVLVARAFNHVGPRQDPWFAASGFARRIADIEGGRWEASISVGNLDARRDITDVRDTVRGYRSILERGRHGDVFNVCSGVAIEIRELLDRLIGRARVPVEIKIDPARYRPNDTPLLLGDPSRIRSRLGWTPQIPLDRTLDDLLDYWRSRD